MLRSEDRPTVARESKHIHAPVNPSKLLAEITNCSSCLSRGGCWSGLRGPEPQSSLLCLSCIPEELGPWGVFPGPGLYVPTQSRLCQHVPLVSLLEMYQEKGETSFILSDLKGAPFLCPQALCEQVKLASERFGIFHKIECDNDII